MNKKQKQAVEIYQCPGCVVGCGTKCFEPDVESVGCKKHVAGTTILPDIGRIFLGMPNGFNRLGSSDSLRISIFEGVSKAEGGWGFGRTGYGKFNVPVWKHLDEHGNTLIRGISPRINWPFLHIYLGDHRECVECFEITTEDVEYMD